MCSHKMRGRLGVDRPRPRGYLSVTQGTDGTIYLFGRGGSSRRMHCVAFHEAWLRQGEPLPPRQAANP